MSLHKLRVSGGRWVVLVMGKLRTVFLWPHTREKRREGWVFWILSPPVPWGLSRDKLTVLSLLSEPRQQEKPYVALGYHPDGWKVIQNPLWSNCVTQGTNAHARALTLRASGDHCARRWGHLSKEDCEDTPSNVTNVLTPPLKREKQDHTQSQSHWLCMYSKEHCKKSQCLGGVLVGCFVVP